MLVCGMTLLLAPLLLLLAQASGQSSTVPPSPPAPPQFTSHRGGRLFISPMGEPFRPAARDDDGLADWFNQADANHDGRLTLDEMQKDAQRFFTTLDVAKDGEIDPDDITRYESEIAPEIQTSRFGLASFDGESRGGERGGGRRQRQGGGAGFFRNDDDQHQGAGRYG